MPANSLTHSVLIRGIRMLLRSVLLLSTLPALSQGQITLDGSLGPRGPLTGPNYRIDANVGQIRDRNLFHSFGQFNVRTNESATFAGPDTITNIVGRVTGGEPSFIDGQLRSEIAGANLFLLNPSGVMFGPNASLAVSGSFHISTADFLRLADGAKFFANLGQESVLTVAPPAAFGFLGNNPAAITIQGSSLKVAEGKALSAVGGDVKIVGGTLSAPSGRIQIASVASPGEVMFSALELSPDLQVDGFARLGRLELSEDTLLDASGNGGGTVLTRSGHLMVDRSNIFADNTGPVDGSGLGVDLRVAADAVITNGAFITADSGGAGRARELRLTAGSLYIDDAVIGSRPFASGDGGNIMVNVGTLTLIGGAQIDSSTLAVGRGGNLTIVATDSISISGHRNDGTPTTLFSNAFGTGDNAGAAGNLFISAPVLKMDDGGRITARTQGDGNAGDIEVRVGRLMLTGGAQIFNGIGDIVNGVAVGLDGPGRGGNLTVMATDSVAIAGRDQQGFSSGLFSGAQFGRGNAGNLFISAPTLSLNDGGRIVANTFGNGNAGNIDVRVGKLTLMGGAQIFSGTGDFLGVIDGVPTFRGVDGPGQGGDLTIMATESISITGRDSQGFRSALASNAQFGRGKAGDIFLSTPTLTMDDGLMLASTEQTSRGDAGNMLLEVGRLTLTGGAQIDSSSFSAGRGGAVSVTATDIITIAGRDREGNPSGLFSSTQSRGPGGNLQVMAPRLQLRDGGTISASSTGDGTAGTLLLQAGEMFRSENGHVTTAAERAGGGAITLIAGQLVQLIDSELTTTVRGGGGDAGNITIDPQFITLEGSRIIANAFEGRGGNIRLTAGVFLADPTSRVEASSTLGINGMVDIRAPVTTLSGVVAPLPQAFVSAAALLPARCAARLSGGKYSSLVLGGREGLPLDPGVMLPSPLMLDDRLAAELAVTGALPRQPSTARWALLTADDKVLSRVRQAPLLGGPPAVLDWGCAQP